MVVAAQRDKCGEMPNFGILSSSEELILKKKGESRQCVLSPSSPLFSFFFSFFLIDLYHLEINIFVSF